MIRRARGPVIVALGLAASGCAATTVDTTATSTVESASTTSLVLDGGRDELLAQLDVELGALSERITEGDGQAEALVRIDAVWATLQLDLQADRPELIAGFQSVVDLARSAVTRRRPADADKARLNVEALLGAAGG